jgi:hypothetical protein
VNEISKKGGGWYYHLIILDSTTKTLQVRSYSRDQLQKATKDYIDTETRATKGEKIEPVLVSAGPLKELRRAYPNYFLDTRDFVGRVGRIIAEAGA